MLERCGSTCNVYLRIMRAGSPENATKLEGISARTSGIRVIGTLDLVTQASLDDMRIASNGDRAELLKE